MSVESAYSDYGAAMQKAGESGIPLPWAVLPPLYDRLSYMDRNGRLYFMIGWIQGAEHLDESHHLERAKRLREQIGLTLAPLLRALDEQVNGQGGTKSSSDGFWWAYKPYKMDVDAILQDVPTEWWQTGWQRVQDDNGKYSMPEPQWYRDAVQEWVSRIRDFRFVESNSEWRCYDAETNERVKPNKNQWQEMVNLARNDCFHYERPYFDQAMAWANSWAEKEPRWAMPSHQETAASVAHVVPWRGTLE